MIVEWEKTDVEGSEVHELMWGSFDDAQKLSGDFKAALTTRNRGQNNPDWGWELRPDFIYNAPSVALLWIGNCHAFNLSLDTPVTRASGQRNSQNIDADG